MEPFYFGQDDSLFGVYHAAEGVPKRHSIVIAAPLLNEYMRAHFALRQIALKLAQSGFDVIRFDYSGMGNSKGSLEDIPPEQWEEDVFTATREVAEISGNSLLSFVAVRFAANLAAAVTRQRKVRHFIMWDPILQGSQWLELLAKVRPIVTTQFSRSLVVKDREFMGHVTHPSFADSIGGRSQASIEAGHILAVSTDKEQAAFLPPPVLEQTQYVDYPCGWENLSSQLLYPHEVIDTICSALT